MNGHELKEAKQYTIHSTDCIPDQPAALISGAAVAAESRDDSRNGRIVTNANVNTLDLPK